MFRFAFDKDAPIAANTNELTTAGITEDEDWGQRPDGREDSDVRYFRVENESPDSVEEAVSYVQGIFMHPPERVWIDGDPHEVTDDVIGRARKPHA